MPSFTVRMALFVAIVAVVSPRIATALDDGYAPPPTDRRYSPTTENRGRTPTSRGWGTNATQPTAQQPNERPIKRSTVPAKTSTGISAAESATCDRLFGNPQSPSNAYPTKATATKANTAKPLPPPRRADGPPLTIAPLDGTKNKDDDTSDSSSTSALQSLVKIFGSLAIVLGLFFVFVWFMRKNMPQSMLTLSTDVVEVLGRAPLVGRQQMHLIRIGQKLLLVSITPAGAETLTEITDPIEVERLAEMCQKRKSGGITKSFRTVFAQFGTQQPTTPTPDHEYEASPSTKAVANTPSTQPKPSPTAPTSSPAMTDPLAQFDQNSLSGEAFGRASFDAEQSSHHPNPQASSEYQRNQKEERTFDLPYESTEGSHV